MNVDRFKEEFIELWRRFTASDYDKNPYPIAAPLTNEEILEVVHEVLNLKLDITLVASTRDDVRTPASGIVMTTPNAPDIQKVNTEQNGGMSGRFRSLDTLTSERLKNSPVDDLILPEPGPLMSKNEGNIDVITVDVPDIRGDEKNYMSKSSPSVSAIVRSDTFVRKDEFECVKNSDVFDEKNIQKIASDSVGTENSMTEANLAEILKKLGALRDAFNDVSNKIDDFQKCASENKTRPIRRLSAMDCFPGSNRTSTTLKTTQRSKLTRRSFAAFPGTPTSSRLIPGTAENEEDSSMRRKSASALSLVNTGGSRLSIPSTYRSVSSGGIVIPKKSPKKLSPASGSHLSGIKPQKTPAIRSPSTSLFNFRNKSIGRQSKNPKYAHVQSTIPKAGGTSENRQANKDSK